MTGVTGKGNKAAAKLDNAIMLNRTRYNDEWLFANWTRFGLRGSSTTSNFRLGSGSFHNQGFMFYIYTNNAIPIRTTLKHHGH